VGQELRRSMYKIYCINCGSDKIIAENSGALIGFRCKSCRYWDYSINYEKQKGGSMNKVEVVVSGRSVGIYDMSVGEYAIVVGGCIGCNTNIGDVIYSTRSLVANLNNPNCSYQNGAGDGITVEVLPEGTEIKIVVGV
jgi:hypothetical protein